MGLNQQEAGTLLTHQNSATYTSLGLLLSLGLSALLTGCGESEDFSQPLPQAQKAIADNADAVQEPALGDPEESEDNSETTEPASDTGESDTAIAGVDTTNTSESGEAQGGADPVGGNSESSSNETVATDTTSSEESIGSEAPETASTSEEPGDESASKEPDDSTNVAEETETADDTDKPKMLLGGGGGASNNKKDSQTPPKKSGGLFGGNLFQGANNDDKTGGQASNKNPTALLDDTVWKELVTKLSDRFRTSMSMESRFAVASASRTTVEVVNFDYTEPLEHRQVLNIAPRFVESVAILDKHPAVLVGTTDGHLVIRRYDQGNDRDIYSTDLIALQDEIRPAIEVGEGAVRFVKRVANDRIATLTTEDSTIRIWNIKDILKPVTEVDKITVDSIKLSTDQPEPVASVTLPGSKVIQYTPTDTRERAAMVLSDATVLVVNYKTGAITHQLDRTLLDVLNQELPCCAVLDGQNSLFLGTTTGTLLTARMGKDGSIEDQTIINPEPENQDRRQQRRKRMPVTTISRKRIQPPLEQPRVVLGFDDGSVTEYEFDGTEYPVDGTLHRGPIVEIEWSEKLGRFSRSTDRNIAFRQKPVELTQNHRVGFSNVVIPSRFGAAGIQLAIDPTRIVTDPRRNRRGFSDASTTVGRITQTVVRPIDTELAILQHQLRSTEEVDRRVKLQKEIVTKLKSASLAEGIGKEIDGGEGESPVLVNEFRTYFNTVFANQTRMLAAVSNDARLASVSFEFMGLESRRGDRRTALDDNPLIVWDVAAGVELRRWNPRQILTGIRLLENQNAVLPLPAVGQYSLTSGDFSAIVDNSELYPISHAFSNDMSQLTIGLMSNSDDTIEAIKTIDLQSGDSIDAFPAFQGAVTAVAYSADDTSLFVAIREKARTRTLELDPLTFNTKSMVFEELNRGTWNPDQMIQRKGRIGATYLLPSPGGRLLLSHGQFEDGGYKLKILKRRSDEWPESNALITGGSEPFVDLMFPQAAFVKNSESRIAIASDTKVTVFAPKDGQVRGGTNLTVTNGTAPLKLITPDSKSILIEDGSGRVKAYELDKMDREPKEFTAQSGPILAMALSPNGKYLVTVGEENMMKVWRVDKWLE